MRIDATCFVISPMITCGSLAYRLGRGSSYARLLLRSVPVNNRPLLREITPTAPRTDAERRQLTIMFCDLVGSTALFAGLEHRGHAGDRRCVPPLLR